MPLGGFNSQREVNFAVAGSLAGFSVRTLVLPLGSLAGTHLSAYFRHGDAGVGLAQGKHDLGFGKLSLFHDIVWNFKV
jgi:hypothetical protein